LRILKGKHLLKTVAMVPVLFMALGIILIPSVAFSIDRNSPGPGKSGSVHLQIHPDYAQSTMIVLFNVKNGKVKKSFHSKADLFNNPEITVDGYVAGIIAFTDAEQDIYVDDMLLQQVSRKKDGAIGLNYSEKLKPKEISILGMGDHQDSADIAINRYFEDHSVMGYSFFPIIPGDPISPDNRFTIGISKNGKKHAVSVYQNGYRNFLREEALSDEVECQIRYLGDGFDSLERQMPDYQERIDVIIEGVAEVEKTFQTRVVRKINMVDYDGIHNALTSVGYKDIWFFIETFKKEPVSELKTIARHEALHLLVDKYDFTKSGQIREIFAELKGYDQLSLERFFLVTQGKSPNPFESREKRHYFFDFVNEKNFLPGSKGGHSQDNLDEFCTSFLHSLMFPELIGTNLHSPLEIGANRPPLRLNTDEQAKILTFYQRMIASFTTVIGRDTVIGSDESRHLIKFMETAFSSVEDLIEKFVRVANLGSSRKSL
jgi:hypothetical protein